MWLTWVGHSAFGDQLGEQDPKGPDVGLDGEAAVQGGLGCRPFNGELGSCDGNKERPWGEFTPPDGAHVLQHPRSVRAMKACLFIPPKKI